MEREIIFRGIDAETGEWVYGCGVSEKVKILNTFCRWFQSKGGERFETEFYDAIQVEPDTVGEYTGMKDCNGSEIFEGDILKISDSKESNVVIVTYSFASWCIKNEQGKLSICDILKKNMKGEKYIFEVIGNIHDNPELLK